MSNQPIPTLDEFMSLVADLNSRGFILRSIQQEGIAGAVNRPGPGFYASIAVTDHRQQPFRYFKGYGETIVAALRDAMRWIDTPHRSNPLRLNQVEDLAALGITSDMLASTPMGDKPARMAPAQPARAFTLADLGLDFSK